MAVQPMLQIALPNWRSSDYGVASILHERDGEVLIWGVAIGTPAKPLYDLSAALKPARKMRRGTADYSQSLCTWPSYSLM